MPVQESKNESQRDPIQCLLDRIDRMPPPPNTVSKTDRWYRYRVYPLAVTIDEPGGSRRSIVVIGRNMAESGMHFVYRGYVHATTRCTIQLPTVDSSWDSVDGTVRRCQLVTNLVYDVGVEFAHPVDPFRFVPLELSGRVLVAECSPAPSKILAYVLRKAGAVVEEVSTASDAVTAANQRWFDTLLIDVDLPDQDGFAVVDELRKQGVVTPVILLCEPERNENHDRWKDVGANDLIVKPFVRHDLLHRVIAQVNQAAPLYSTLAGDPEMESLISEFVDYLPMMLTRSRQFLKEHDLDALLNEMSDIRSAATMYGFRPLSDAALDVEDFLLQILAETVQTPAADAEAQTRELRQRALKLWTLGARVRVSAGKTKQTSM